MFLLDVMFFIILWFKLITMSTSVDLFLPGVVLSNSDT